MVERSLFQCLLFSETNECIFLESPQKVWPKLLKDISKRILMKVLLKYVCVQLIRNYFETSPESFSKKKTLIFTSDMYVYTNWTNFKFKCYYASRFMYVLPKPPKIAPLGGSVRIWNNFKLANSNVCKRCHIVVSHPSLTSGSTLHPQRACL